MRTADYDFELPVELVAQHPLKQRDDSRLLVLDRGRGIMSDHRFGELPSLLRPGDLLVMNDSKVIRARLRAVDETTSGRLELLLLTENAANDWWVMMKPGKRGRVGLTLRLLTLGGDPSPWTARVLDVNDEGHRRMLFNGPGPMMESLGEVGEVPLPPYIRRVPGGESKGDEERYQTIYARHPGSVAAPTAGLHFTAELIDRLRSGGVAIGYVTLHVGLGTFAPVKTEILADHRMHEERFAMPESTAELLEKARRERGRVIAVGTTTVRVLESLAATRSGRWRAGSGSTRIFIRPPFEFKVVGGLITNFHLPRSTLLMLASAFAAPGGEAGRAWMLEVYREAVRRRYRFFSYGDAMFIQ